MKSILWCSGWGICPKELLRRVSQVFSEFNHHVVIPNSTTIYHVESHDFQSVQYIVGYSLGAFIMLKHWERLSVIPIEKILLAPFLDLKKSSMVGGKVDSAQLLYVKRRLVKDPLNTLQDFYKQTNLHLKLPGHLPYSMNDLEWGINYLYENRITPKAYFSDISAIIGSRDILIDSYYIKKYFKNIHIEDSATHCIVSLLPYLRQRLV